MTTNAAECSADYLTSGHDADWTNIEMHRQPAPIPSMHSPENKPRPLLILYCSLARTPAQTPLSFCCCSVLMQQNPKGAVALQTHCRNHHPLKFLNVCCCTGIRKDHTKRAQDYRGDTDAHLKQPVHVSVVNPTERP